MINICNNLLRLTIKFINGLFGFTNGLKTSIIAINLILIGNFQRLLTKNKANALSKLKCTIFIQNVSQHRKTKERKMRIFIIY
jgi:hypothetical protein